jgi:hypothetical protein
MNVTRRTAMGMAASMVAASVLAAVGKPRHAEGAGPRLDLDRLFPSRFGPWRVDEAMKAFVRPASAQAKRFKIYDQVLERSFLHDGGQAVMLSVAYGSEQSAGLQLHRPETCYQGGGFDVRDTHPAMLKLDDRRAAGPARADHLLDLARWRGGGRREQLPLAAPVVRGAA